MSDHPRRHGSWRTRLRPGRLGVAVAVATVSVPGCASPYGQAEGALQDWLDAVAHGDPAACSLETAAMHDELLERHARLGGEGTDCADRVARMGALGLPTSDAEMDVPAWDPSGEALVEVSGSGTGTRWKFWMVQDDDERWLVAGQAD